MSFLNLTTFTMPIASIGMVYGMQYLPTFNHKNRLHLKVADLSPMHLRKRSPPHIGTASLDLNIGDGWLPGLAIWFRAKSTSPEPRVNIPVPWIFAEDRTLVGSGRQATHYGFLRWVGASKSQQRPGEWERNTNWIGAFGFHRLSKRDGW